MIRLSVLIPVLNEQATLTRLVEGVVMTGLASEILIIDDGSTDGSPAIIDELERRHPELVRSVRHPVRRGKGAAVRSGLSLARGDVVLIQDADLEYDPLDFPALLAPFENPDVSVVYGSRNRQANPRSSFSFYWGGRLLSGVTNLLYGSSITDESTGYKLVRTELMRSLDLRSEGFDFCAELTGKLLGRGVKIHEVPISYRPRSSAEGKKIRWIDGVTAIRVLTQLRFPKWPILAAALLIAFTALVAYHNSFSGAFVFDDKGAILDNPTLRDLWPPRSVLSPPINGLPVTGRPLTNLSFAINYAAHGTSPFGYHLVNFTIHLWCALTLFGVVRRTLLQPVLAKRFGVHALPLATAAAVLWATHPLQTAAVTYISQRPEALASAMILTALYAFIRGRGDSAPSAGDRNVPIDTANSSRGWLAGSVLACWLAIGAKEIAYVIPMLVILYDRVFFRRTWRSVFSEGWFFHLALFASWLPLAWLIQSTENRGATWAADAGFTPWNYGLLQCEALVHYVRLVFWPVPLVFDYGRNLSVPTLSAVGPQAALLIVLVVATAIATRRSSAAALLGVGFFAILAPTSSFVPIADPMFEHRMYLPSALMITGAILVVYRICGARIAWVMPPLAIALCAATISRNADYQDPIALWSDTVEKRPTNARAHGNLGELLTRQHRYAEALPHLEAAYRLTPQQPIAPHNFANALDLLGRREEAIPYYREALALQPTNHLARANLAHALAGTGALDEALALFEETLRDVPNFAEAHRDHGRALLRAGRTNEAIVAFKRAAELRPLDPDAHFNLADALARDRRFPEAIVALREAIRLRPDHVAALNNLGNALLVTRQVPEAIVVLQQALSLQPHPQTHTNLGLAFLLSQRRDEAIAQFEAALRLKPDHAPALSALQRLRR
ncbi:MAG TPA: tetratricopeptide repeat protein [Opitutus sp.]|nr:tetratricopeptide repeat protein [Opitutus sp.]